MSVTANLATILAELERNSRAVEEAQLQALVNELTTAGHVFAAAAGRSRVALTGFVNRLGHLGRSASLVGEITSPHSAPGDLLLVGSGSGRTTSLVAQAARARAVGMRIALVTLDPDSPLAGLADVVVVLPGASPKAEVAATSVQPMGSAFEQLSFLVYDALVLELMDRLGQDSESMFSRHADLE